MKKILKYIPSVLFCLSLASCEYDYLEPKKADLNVPVDFTKDVMPVLTLNCVKSGCHVTGGVPPDLSVDKAYEQLMGLGYVDTTNAEGSILYARMISSSKPMPPAGKLSASQTGTILAWIKQGAKN